MNPHRFLRLATIYAAIMCCAGALQLTGINRLVVSDGRIAASSSTVAPAPLGHALPPGR